MPNERWSTNRRAKFSFKHSIGRTRSGRFFLYACRINYVQLLTLIVDIRGRRHEATYECQVKIPFHHGLRYSDESIWEQPFQKNFDSHTTYIEGNAMRNYPCIHTASDSIVQHSHHTLAT